MTWSLKLNCHPNTLEAGFPHTISGEADPGPPLKQSTMCQVTEDGGRVKTTLLLETTPFVREPNPLAAPATGDHVFLSQEIPCLLLSSLACFSSRHSLLLSAPAPACFLLRLLILQAG